MRNTSREGCYIVKRGSGHAVQSWVSQLRKGLTELMVLGILRRRESYGYEILQRLRVLRDLEMSESTLYPLLARLTRDGLLESRTVLSASGPPRRYYRLTPQGEATLAQMESHWTELNQTIRSVLEATE